MLWNMQRYSCICLWMVGMLLLTKYNHFLDKYPWVIHNVKTFIRSIQTIKRVWVCSLVRIHISQSALVFVWIFRVNLFKVFPQRLQVKSSEFPSTIEVEFVDIKVKRRHNKVPISLEDAIESIEDLVVLREPLDFLGFLVVDGFEG